MPTPQLLIISDDRGRVEKIREHLRVLGPWDVVVESSLQLSRGTLGLMIADAVVIDFDGLVDSAKGMGWVSECRSAFRPVPVVALRDGYDEREALACFELGVSDVLSLDLHADRLAHIVTDVTIEASLRTRTRALPAGIRDRLAATSVAASRTK